MAEGSGVGVRSVNRLVSGARTRETVRRTKEEGGSTWRVWVKEWLFEHRHPDKDFCRHGLEDKYGGRLDLDDMAVDLEEDTGQYVASARKWTVLGEFKTEAIAKAFLKASAVDLGDGVWLLAVERNTKAEQKLKDYGRILCPATG